MDGEHWLCEVDYKHVRYNTDDSFPLENFDR